MFARITISRRLTAVALLALAAAALLTIWSGTDAVAQDADASLVKIPLVVGDSLQVRFKEPFNAGDLAKGLVPEAVVAHDKVISGVVLVTADTPVGVLVEKTAAVDNGRAGKAGQFKLTFKSVDTVDGQTIALDSDLERKGKGRGIIAKIFTLFLIKGEDPGVTSDEIFWPRFTENIYVYAERP